MIRNRNHKLLFAGTLLSVALFTACSDDDSYSSDVVQEINAELTFALPQRIVGNFEQTRMKPDVVQYEGTSLTFRGLDDIHLLSFDSKPGPQSASRGEVAYLGSTAGRIINLATDNDYSVACHVKVPVGTTHFGFYAHAVDGSDSPEDRFRYGAIETKGLNGQANTADIGFAPVSICSSEADQGGSAAGQALVQLLNTLASTTGPEAAPNDRWATATDKNLRETWRGMTELKTLSSANVERVLGQVYRLVLMIREKDPGKQLGNAIAATIANACATTPESGSDKLTLSDQYQGFPADLYLPEGAARIAWNAGKQRFETPPAHVYGKGLDIPAMSDYVYPANLQYLALSPIVASDSLALPGNELAEQEATTYNNWKQLIDECYVDGYEKVKESTQSVAMVDQVQYAVGRLDARVSTEGRTLYDAYGKAIDCSNGFTLKGILVGGQHEVGYDFEPKADTHEYVLYDTDLNGGPQKVKNGSWTKYNHTLGLATPADANELIALELQNDGPEFQGADGRIAEGATFYLVANMNPVTAQNYQKGSVDRIFQRDYVTKVNLMVLKGKADINGDGKPDTDTNGDGTPDNYTFDPETGLPDGLDTDGDGQKDENTDINGDGTPDTIVNEDTDGDGKPDAAGWDTDGDGDIDIPILPDEDGHWPDTPTDPEGLGTATYGIPTLEDKNELRHFGLSVDLLWSRGFIFDIIEM
ncbi:MAG: hypothetical protein II949_14610 [Prevotella sp.]|nr:hypothetical protein [Prevotella sp.]